MVSGPWGLRTVPRSLVLVLGGPGRGELGPAEEVAGLLTLDPLVGVCG